jgi:hypothetical protein
MRLFRHLVPASQLPDDIFIDTSDEEDEEEGDEEEVRDKLIMIQASRIDPNNEDD